MRLFGIILLCSIFPIQSIFADTTTDAIIKQIDYLQKKHEIIATNIANVSTPKYQAKDLEAPELLNRHPHKIQLKKVRLIQTNEKHFQSRNNKQGGKYTVLKDNSGEIKPNKNNVNLSKQVEKIALNSDQTSTALKNYRSSIDLLAAAAEAGGGGK